MAVRNQSPLARRGLLSASLSATVLVVMLVVGLASAQQPEHVRVTLDYTVAANASNCPTRDAFADAVASRLGYDPFVPSSARTVRVSVTFAKSSYAGTVLMGGSRSLSSPDCHELVDSLAVAVALGLDPDSALRPPPSASSALPARPPPSATTSVSASAPAPSPSSPPSSPAPRSAGSPPFERSVSVLGGPFGSLGDTPSPTLGLALGAEVALAKRLSLEAELSGTLPSSVRIGTGGRGTASAFVARALVGICLPVEALSFCATGSGGVLRAEATDVDVARSDLSSFGAAGLRASFRIALSSRVFVRAVLDGQVPLSRVDLRIDGASLWETAPVVGRLGLVLGARLW